jgi:hypothetical protein
MGNHQHGRKHVGARNGPTERAVHGYVRVIGMISDVRHPFRNRKPDSQLSTMPPMSFLGVVTKSGFMNKTATVAVSRWVVDAKTGKVRYDR